MSEEESTLNLQVMEAALCVTQQCFALTRRPFLAVQNRLGWGCGCVQALQEACPNSPWRLTFSYGRALQSTTLKVSF